MNILDQWWILGEENEVVGSTPPLKIAHIVLVSCRCFLEIIIKLGRKVGSTRSIRGEDFFFLETTMILGEK